MLARPACGAATGGLPSARERAHATRCAYCYGTIGLVRSMLVRSPPTMSSPA
jgi:hypothetical protein